jgi:hypothetical protein
MKQTPIPWLCAILLLIAWPAGAKPTPGLNVTPTFPNQGASSSEPASISFTLQGQNARKGKLSFSAVRYQPDGGVPTKEVSFTGSTALSPKTPATVQAKVAKPGVYEVVVQFTGDDGNSCGAIVIIVSDKGKIWLGRDSLTSVAKNRIEAEQGPHGGSSPAISRILKLEQEMTELYQKP